MADPDVSFGFKWEGCIISFHALRFSPIFGIGTQIPVLAGSVCNRTMPNGSRNDLSDVLKHKVCWSSLPNNTDVFVEQTSS